MNKLYVIYITNVFNEYSKYLFKGSKENLMTLIGCIYSTSMVGIERIAYREVIAIPHGIEEIMYYIIEDNIKIVRKVYTESEVYENEL